ncbi:MAG: ankyrin repeat domain-containing protein, partial [Acholeplasmatales bacterium]|nr:ankyrin repeat domain-containing protein [Acholeplasmatales bacterium]
VSYLNYKNNYPLIYAVISHNTNLVKYNLNYIEINKKDSDNLSALDYANMYQYPEYVKLIKSL